MAAAGEPRTWARLGLRSLGGCLVVLLLTGGVSRAGIVAVCLALALVLSAVGLAERACELRHARRRAPGLGALAPLLARGFFPVCLIAGMEGVYSYETLRTLDPQAGASLVFELFRAVDAWVGLLFASYCACGPLALVSALRVTPFTPARPPATYGFFVLHVLGAALLVAGLGIAGALVTRTVPPIGLIVSSTAVLGLGAGALSLVTSLGLYALYAGVDRLLPAEP